MQKTKIEWAKNPDGTQGFSWNPIRGLCPVKCKLPDGRIYCYGRKNYKRFLWPKDISLDMHELTAPFRRKKPSGIFICSTFELFHPVTANEFSPISTKFALLEMFGKMRDGIFNMIKNCPQHRFYILTKFPQNIDREMPDNVWLGVTITKSTELPKIGALNRAKAKLKFISFEPLLGNIDPRYGLLRSIKWVIIGRLTSYGRKYNPTEIQLKTMFTRIRATIWSPPIFLKDNLKEIWGDELIQEMPE